MQSISMLNYSFKHDGHECLLGVGLTTISPNTILVERTNPAALCTSYTFFEMAC